MSTAVVLAGGLSTRMGYDKKLIELDDELLLQTTCDEFSDQFDEVLIISNTPVKCLDQLKDNVFVYDDIIKGCGPLGGIHAALTYAKSDSVYVVACDMPNYNASYMNYMSHFNNSDAVVTRFGEWIEPFHAYYHKRLIVDIEKYLHKGRRSIFGLLNQKKVYYVDESIARTYTPNWKLFFNINTKEDLNNDAVI